ncbi:MAG: HAMP domain-containing sensor histidine kinase [Anaerolineae bacterium]
MDKKIDSQVLLDAMGHGVLIFDSSGKLVAENQVARSMLGKDIDTLRTEGWAAASVLFGTRVANPYDTADAARDRAKESGKPARFHTYRSGEYVPCWASMVKAEDGDCTMIALDLPDWSVLSELMDKFSGEVKEAIETTQGHVDLITQTVKQHKPNDTVETVSKRITGFVRLIDIHMHRVGRLVTMMDRLEKMRTGKLQSELHDKRRKVTIEDFLEDFVEGLDEIQLLDPETDEKDYRARITHKVDADLKAHVVPSQLTVVLQDILRNAIMYSMKATPVKIEVRAVNNNEAIQFDVIDEGYGVRDKERERVFTPFQRARQPQIISEFGYGLSLYLCKHEVEAMNGRMWFKSEEGVGSTFSLTVPAWREEAASSSSSSKPS